MVALSRRVSFFIVLLSLLIGPGSASNVAVGARAGDRALGQSRPVVASRALVWSAAGSLSAPRSSHTATRLPDGRVLVAGGADSEAAELYDPVADAWQAVDRLRQGRLAHTATLLSGG